MQTLELGFTEKKGIVYKKVKWRNISWVAIFVCMLCIVLVPSLYIPLTWLMAPFIGILFFYDDFYALCGMFLFFEENIVIIPGLAMFAVYSALVIIKYFVFDKCQKKLPVLVLPAIIIMFMYALFVMPTADTTVARLSYINSGREPPSDMIINMRLIIGYATDSITIILLALRLAQDKKVKNILCVVIVISSVLSGLYGYIAGNIFMYGGEGEQVARYMASFNDPNYASFFFNAAIFIVFTNEAFKKLYIKIPVTIVLYYFLVATGSLSGLSFNVIGIVLLTVFKYRLKAVFALVGVAIIMGGVWMAITRIPQLSNLSVIVNLQSRIERQFEDKEETSMATATSGRETQWKNYWGYFKQQELEKKLFGGNLIMSYSVDYHLKTKFGNVPHQAYIGFILNFGIIGATIFVGFFLIKQLLAFIIMCRDGTGLNVFFFLMGCMWFFYGFGFDYFGDWRFMIFYFL